MGVVLTAAGLSFSIQQALVVPALPAMQHELHTTNAWAAWLLSIFLISAAVCIPVLGRLGDQFGRRRVLVAALVLFFLGSVGATAAWDIGSLIGFRALQGAGGAAFPLAFAIVRDEFPPARVGMVVSLISSVFGIGGMIGVVISGPIVDSLSWRFLFALGACVSGASILLVLRFIPETPASRLAPSRIDLPGATLLSSGLVCFLLGLTEGDRLGWGSPAIVGLLCGSALLLVTWGRVELRVPLPMVDMRMLARRAVLFPNVTTLLLGVAIFGVSIIVPNYVQTPERLPGGLPGGFGTDVTHAGFYFVPSALAMFLLPPLVGLVGRPGNLRQILALGMLLTAASCAYLAVWHARPWHVVLAMVIFGAGNGMVIAVAPRLIMAVVEPVETGVATGINMVVRMVGGVVGAQIIAAFLSAHIVGGTQFSSESGFVLGLWVLTGVGLIGSVTGLLGASHRVPECAASAPSRV